MKPFDALATLEFADIPTGMVATDLLLKASPLAFVRSGTIGGGRYLTVIGGSPAAVDEAHRTGVDAGAASLVDALLLADADPRVIAAVLDGRVDRPSESLAVLETATATAAVLAAELALKGARVGLVELRLADTGLAGKGLLTLHGELHDLEAALDIVATGLATAGGRASSRIISAPHDALARQAASTSRFASSAGLALDGEHD